jgi:hypothetical protein
LLLIPAVQVAAVRFVDPPRTLPMWIEQISSGGPKPPLRYHWIGRGIYGVEAASQHYFGVSARGLTREQSAMLAAVLPNPKGWDPTKPSGKLRWRQQRILQRERKANFPEKLLH